MKPANPLRSGVALLAALTLLLDPAVPLVAAAMAPGQATAKPAPAAAGATVAVDTAVDGGWPRVYDLPSGGTILLYQPQIATWDKQTHMVAYSAVSLRATAPRSRCWARSSSKPTPRWRSTSASSTSRT